MPWYKIQDELEETRPARTGAAFGSIRRGIAYAYSDKYLKIPSTGISFFISIPLIIAFTYSYIKSVRHIFM